MKGLLKRNKKTFIFMTSLLLFLIGAGVIQEIVKNLKPFEDVPVVSVETKDENKNQGSEILKKPVNDDVKVSKGFYDTSLDDKKLEEALVYFEGVYRPNDGIDYTKDNESFDVYASASGTVIRKENDSLLGWIVTIEHQKGIQTIYQSLDDIKVEKGDQVKQGDVIGKAGNNVYQSTLKKHLHFIVSIDDKTVNPDKYFNQKNKIMTMNMRFFIIAAAATLLAACTQENEVQNNPVEARITAGVSGPKTRAVDNGWNADRTGVMVVDAPGTTTTMGGKYKNVGYATTSTGTNADFTPMTAGGGIFFEDAFLEFTFAAYAPYASGANASTLPGTDGKITVNTSNQPTTTEQEKVDYIHATGAKADKDSPTVSFTDNTAAGGSDCSFKHKMARLILKVQVSNTDGFDDTAVLEFADYKLGGLVHEGTFDVKTGTAATAGSVVSDWMLRQCTGAPKTATDKCVATFDAATGVMTFTMILLPQTLANALVLEISPDDGEYQSYSNKDMIKPALEAGYSYTYTITVKKTGLTLSGSTIENWNDGGSHAGDAKM